MVSQASILKLELEHKASLYVLAVLVLSIVTVIAVVVVYVARPEQNNASITTAIIGITTPASIAFTAMAVKEVYAAQNSRLTELLKLTAESSEARGKLSRD